MFKHTGLSDASESQARGKDHVSQLSEYLVTYSPAHKQMMNQSRLPWWLLEEERNDITGDPEGTCSGRWHTHTHSLGCDCWTPCWMAKKPVSGPAIRGILWARQSPLTPLPVKAKGPLCDQCDVTLLKCVVMIAFLKCLFKYLSVNKGRKWDLFKFNF